MRENGRITHGIPPQTAGERKAAVVAVGAASHGGISSVGIAARIAVILILWRRQTRRTFILDRKKAAVQAEFLNACAAIVYGDQKGPVIPARKTFDSLGAPARESDCRAVIAHLSAVILTTKNRSLALRDRALGA